MAGKIGNQPFFGIRQLYVFYPTTGQTSISGADANGVTLAYDTSQPPNVTLNGVRLVQGVDFQATTGSSITGLDPLTSGDVIVIEVMGTWSPANLGAENISWSDPTWFSDKSNTKQVLTDVGGWLWSLENDMILDEYVRGLNLSNNVSDANNDIDIGVGRARGNGVSVTNSSTITKQLDSVWAAGTGNGGLDTGAKAANQTYHIHSIRRDNDGLFDALMSLSVSNPTVPNGWTRVQRLGAIMTDGTGNIRPFIQDGNTFHHNTIAPPVEYSGSTRSKSALTVTAPAGIRVRGIFQFTGTVSTGDSGINAAVFDGANPNIGRSFQVYVSANAKAGRNVVEQHTNASSQIQFELVGQGGTYAFSTLGWVDYQIPRIGA